MIVSPPQEWVSIMADGRIDVARDRHVAVVTIKRPRQAEAEAKANIEGQMNYNAAPLRPG